MILKLGMQHPELKLYKVNINDDPGLTLTYFTARLIWVAYRFEQSHLMGENLQQMTKLTEKLCLWKKYPRGLSGPALGLNTCIWP